MTKNLDKKIKTLAAEYWNEFLTTEIDGEWTQTAFEDLGELKSEMEWAEFHSCIEYQVKEIALEDVDEPDTSNFLDGVFII